jgi:hypothetical protein
MNKEELERKTNFAKEVYKHNTGNKPKAEQSTSYPENDQEYLKKELEKYKMVFSNYVYEYLQSLVALETVVTKNELPVESRRLLKELLLFKKVAVYNVKAVARKTLQNTTSINTNEILASSELLFNQNDNNAIAFQYDTISGYDAIGPLGQISLFKIEENPELIAQELEKSQKLLEQMKSTKPPKLKLRRFQRELALYLQKRPRNLSSLESYIEYLKSKLELTAYEKELVMLSQEYNNLLMKTLGLNENDFSKPEVLSNDYEERLVRVLKKDDDLFQYQNVIKYI